MSNRDGNCYFFIKRNTSGQHNKKKYYRTTYQTKIININEDIITQLPSSYLLNDNQEIEPKTFPDACTIN